MCRRPGASQHAGQVTPRDLAAATPSTRNRAVDLLRVGALIAVVLGHWLKQGWYVEAGGDLHRAGLLGIATWTHPITWVFQVMPVFFVVGGFANTRSWRSAERAGTRYGGWLASRTERLTRPVVPLLVFWVAAVLAAGALGFDHRWPEVASVTALTPMWFLATYVVFTAICPWQVRAWERWGPVSLAAPALAALVVDVVSLVGDSSAIATVNVVLVWGTLHQVGVAWSDGWFDDRLRAVLMAAVGLVGALLLVSLGPYSVSMVGVSGYGVNNTNPTRVTVLALGLFLVGTAIAAERWLDRLARRPRIWAVVVALESRTMTVYLWHLSALGVLGALAMRTGTGLNAYPNTLDWWLLRPWWLLALGCTTAALTLVVGRWESPVWSRAAVDRGPLVPVVEVVVTVAGLGFLASEGMADGLLGITVGVLTATTLWVIDRRLLRGGNRPAPSPSNGTRVRSRQDLRP